MKEKTSHCPLEKFLDITSGKWRVLILRELFLNKVVRFGEFRKSLGGISERILIKELKELENYGIINRRTYAEIPPKVEYSLTELGLTLDPVLKTMSEWGNTYLARNLKIENENTV